MKKKGVSKDNVRNLQYRGQLNANAYKENTDILRQSGNGTSVKCKHNIKPQNGEIVVTTKSGRRIRKPDRFSVKVVFSFCCNIR